MEFIFREEAIGVGKSGRRTIVPGKPDSSELIARVTAKDPEARMPYHGPPLPPQQIALLRQWIKEGAKWEDHWAFVAPKPHASPEVKRAGWDRQPLDRFILARLEKEGLEPSPEADKASLLRRVSLDLTGLPPTLEEQAAYLADSSPDAYEKQVDRLLASPRYGERWAAMWLDLARYADSKGYEADRDRPGVWPYRDWVIDAFNRNLPYDKFVITQLAGDLLPNATFEDQIATSFHRQTPNNDEGGTDDEEFRLVAAMDRSATTWSILNGVTINCVQCHSHPYDPIRHADYYKSLAVAATTTRGTPIFPRTRRLMRVPKGEVKIFGSFAASAGDCAADPLRCGLGPPVRRRSTLDSVAHYGGFSQRGARSAVGGSSTRATTGSCEGREDISEKERGQTKRPSQIHCRNAGTRPRQGGGANR